ncbi:thioredoxin [Coprococcus eutactus]|uniref:thioredoxin n=1 Tax=Coprococcus eutactus TaxID=33043 RepID=UPI00015E8132|nr:thioredoxin [Coprococcus eutactus]EDP25621.1 thioredoxin [Coprococcus eutactus ATCC 27759]UEA78928.1 thioredoxin [Coprococcus eutactus ATCC 27759]UWP16689.1 thioredoxin [Coprococcus eutactus]
MVKKVVGDNFDEIKSSKIAVADFSATWCGPCKMMAPVFHTVAEDMKDATSFFNVDVDENPGLAASNKVFSVPTLILYKDGVEVSRSVGAISKYDLIDFINKNK